MIEIKKSDYAVVSQELIEADIQMYKKSLENWRKKEGVPKPYPNTCLLYTSDAADE